MHIAEDIKVKVQGLLTRTENTLARHLGIEFCDFSKDLVVARMPVNQHTKQPFGLLHGGASLALAETLASIGGWLNVDENKFAVVGIEINANHVRSIREGWVKGTAKPLHRGRRTQVWEIKIESESDNKLVSISRCTLATVDHAKDHAEKASKQPAHSKECA